MASKTRSIRFPLEEMQEWDAFARTKGMTFNKYVVQAVRGQYQLDKAENAEREEQIAERERIQKVAFPQDPKGKVCKHVLPGQFCYRCGEKRW